MPRLNPVDPANAQGKAKGLLDNVAKALGFAPNLMKTLAVSPAALDAYLGFGHALGSASLNAKVRERSPSPFPARTTVSTALPRTQRSAGP